jgi:hypothetical protein
MLRSVKCASMHGNRPAHFNAKWRVLVSKIPAGVVFMRRNSFKTQDQCVTYLLTPWSRVLLEKLTSLRS